MPRYAARVDSNQARLVAYFRAHGCECESTARLGKGFPDYLIGCGMHIALVEFKADGGRLGPEQVAFGKRFARWVVRTETDADVVIRWLKH